MTAVLALTVGGCAGTGQEAASGGPAQDKPASVVTDRTPCAAAVNTYLEEPAYDLFNQAIQDCGGLQELAEAFAGRAITNTTGEILVACTGDLRPPQASGGIDRDTIASKVCREFRDQCVNVNAVQEGYYGLSGGGLEERLDTSAARMAACERSYFGGNKPGPPAAGVEEATFRAEANAICQQMDAVLDPLYEALEGTDYTDAEGVAYERAVLHEITRVLERIDALSAPSSLTADVDWLLEMGYADVDRQQRVFAGGTIPTDDPYDRFDTGAAALGLTSCLDQE